MNKKCYRFFFSFLEAQERWLNRMAAKGYKLMGTGKLLYEFTPCPPGEVEYRMEFIGGKSQDSAQEYRAFLEDLGYKVFYKNVNLNYSIGKVRCRPWAERGGRIATNNATFNRELLIVEKKCDGTPFALHTTFEDRANYYKSIRDPWLFLFVLFALCEIWLRSPVFLAFGLAALLPTVIFQYKAAQMKRCARTREG